MGFTNKTYVSTEWMSRSPNPRFGVDLRSCAPTAFGSHAKDRRILLLLEQKLLLDDPVWMARLSPLLAGGPAPHLPH